MPVITGTLVNAPRFPGNGQTERDLLVGNGTYRVAGSVLPYHTGLDVVLEYAPNRGGPWSAVSFTLPDDPRAWEVLCGNPQAFSAQDAANVIAAVGSMAPPPASVSLLEGTAQGSALAAAALAALGSEQKWELLQERLLHFDRLSALNFLRFFGASSSDAAELASFHGPNLVVRLKRNPYGLAGYPRARFAVLDAIARYVGFNNPPLRRRAYVLCAIAEWIFGRGHTFGNAALYLIRSLQRAFRLPPQQAEREALAALQWFQANLEGYVWRSRQNQRVLYFSYEHLYSAERYAAVRAKALWAAPLPQGAPARVRNAVARAFNLDRDQRQALDVVFGHGISVVTGGPGTGKTHFIAALVEACRQAGLKAEVGAATGRAARNLAARGVPAQTVHRLLGIRPKYGRLESRYHCEGKDGKPPFPADVLIVDEAGMLDAYVFEKVLYAVRDGTRVVLVGDPDQLPPVGPGVPLLDTLQAMLPPHGRGTSVARLTVNHRQGPGSQIPNLAAQINSGSLRVPQLTSNPDVAVDQVPAGTTARQLGPRLVQLAAQYGGTWGAGRPWPPVLVLNPTRDEVADLNRQIQAAVNPGTLPFRVGDPVLQAVNNYEAPLANQPGMTTEVMNGEMGRVVDVQRDAFGNVGRVVVEFDAARVVEYDGQAAEAQLLLAYAMTVHKAQGTEADVVIVPVLSSMRRGRRRVWNRRLLYTAVTRARQRVVIVTDDPAEVAAVARLGGQSRRTRYRWMVRGVFV